MSSNMQSPDPRKKNTAKNDPEIVNFRTINDKKEGYSYDALHEYITGSPKDCIVYAILVISLLMILFDSYYGYACLAIGIIFGIYFANELTSINSKVRTFIEQYGFVKSLIVGATLFTFFISAPFIFIGIALVTLIKALIHQG